MRKKKQNSYVWPGNKLDERRWDTERPLFPE